MSKQKIIITGSKGVIGSVLVKGLKDYEITEADLPEVDVRDFNSFSAAISGHSSIIHLAWDTKTDNFTTGGINPDNSTMFFNVYQSALDNGVKRVIMASSVHADSFYKWSGKKLMSPFQLPNPDSPYGAHKVFMESLGRYFSVKGLEVVCIRFGGVGPDNMPNQEIKSEKAVFLSHKDLISLVSSVLKASSVPNNYSIVYGISNNTSRIHDISNPFGWVPQDNAREGLK